ncbi:hypothetical protein [Stieleria mannarensis]|uniref:hypothetical protein n=1 Tax=Stieleria mannarensis TaxID=2755585 RepID=UPI001603CAAF|nr:hypothetical protein [Rhodopirellula sp. JC639]
MKSEVLGKSDIVHLSSSGAEGVVVMALIAVHIGFDHHDVTRQDAVGTKPRQTIESAIAMDSGERLRFSLIPIDLYLNVVANM